MRALKHLGCAGEATSFGFALDWLSGLLAD